MVLIRFFYGVTCNLIAGLRLAFFLKVRPWHFSVEVSQALALLVISFLLPFLQDYVNTVPDHRFNPFGLSYQATLYLLFLFSVFVLLWLQNHFRSLLKMVVIFLSIVPTIWLICLFIDELGERQEFLSPVQTEWAVFGFYASWYLLVISRALIMIFHASIPRTLLLVMVYAGLNIPVLFYIPGQPLWYAISSGDGDKKETISQINVEDTYYLQDDLLAMYSGSLSPHTPGKTDIYYLGFAGYADEDVFKNEALFVKQLMEQKYIRPGNAIVLINNQTTLTKYPLASRHNLETALRMIAGNIDVEEDIVFMFFTSHGSKDHHLSVKLSPMGLNDLTPIQIHNAILGAGIKWKVIVISSCYSGGFVNDLQDPYTLLITAADHDRNSFGCGHDGRFTYFGEAFFNYALNQTLSLVDAFHIAEQRISQREQDEGYKPSRPRMIIGEKIEQKLDAFYDTLEKTE